MTISLDWGLALAVIGVVLTLYGIWLAQRSERRKRLVWDVAGSIPLASLLPHEEPGPKLTVQYEPESGPAVNVRGCYMSMVMVANLGREPIKREDLAGSDPLRLEVTGTKVLDAAIAGVTRDPVNFEVAPLVVTGDAVTARLSFEFLDFKDGASIRLLTEGWQPEVTVRGTVVGMPEGIQRFGERRNSQLWNRAGAVTIVVLFALSILTGLWTFHMVMGSWDRWWLLLLVPAMLIVPALLSLALATFIWPSERWPTGLHRPVGSSSGFRDAYLYPYLALEVAAERPSMRGPWRRRKGQDVWHWCRNCSNYPTGPDLEVSHTKPTSGELDNECRAKQMSGKCAG